MPSDIAEQINKLSAEFDERTFERHQMGEEKYGAGTWLGIDTLEMAIEEVLDLGNYIRFTYVKLRILQEDLAARAKEIADGSTAKPKPGNEMLGKNAMVKGVGLPE